MKLGNCIRKAGAALKADDREALTAAVRAHIADGLDPHAAAVAALQDQLAEAQTELQEVVDAIAAVQGVSTSEPEQEKPAAKEQTDPGASAEETAEIADEFDQAEQSATGESGPMHHLFERPAKSDVVRLADKVKVYHAKHGWMTVDEAKAKIREWEDHAVQQGKKGLNSDKVVLSLFDLTGEWSLPWEQAGYDVYRFDIQNAIDAKEQSFADPESEDYDENLAKSSDVNHFSVGFFNDLFGSFDGKDIYAILAACPCTDFASSGARHFAAKDADGRTIASVELVQQALRTIEYFKPAVWAIENPVGRIEKLTGLPPWRTSFDPNAFGDPYTKKTLLWGRHNGDMPIAPVEPTEGSKMHSQYGGKSQKTKNARSVTPEGFAYAFFMANNAVDHPVMALANKYDRLAPKAIEAAVNAGLSDKDVANLIDDFYYQDLDDAAANKALYDAGKKETPPAAPAKEGEVIAANERTPEDMGREAGRGDGESQARIAPSGLSPADQKLWLKGYDAEMLPRIPKRDADEGPAITVDTAQVAARDWNGMSVAERQALLRDIDLFRSTDKVRGAGLNMAGAAVSNLPWDKLSANHRAHIGPSLVGNYRPTAETKPVTPQVPANEGAAPIGVHSNKAEMRPYRKPDGSVGYAAVPIVDPLPEPSAAPTIEATEEPNGTRTELPAGSEDGPAGDAGPGAGVVQRVEGQGPPGEGDKRPRKAVRRNLRPVDESGDLFAQQPGPEPREGAVSAEPVPGSSSGTSPEFSPRVPAKRVLPDGVSDYHAPLGSLERQGSWRDAAARNLDIIELVRKLEEEKRQATPEEQKLLTQFTGWGAAEIRNNLFKTVRDYNTGKVRLVDSQHMPRGWESIGERAAKVLTEDELKTALQSTQYAHYTSEPVVRGIWSALERMGFKGGRIFEPGMGNGAFPIMAPQAVLDASTYTGIELDKFTADIARQLLPGQNVLNADFVKQKMPNGYFDLAIGNPPFARTKILDDPAYKAQRFSLHDYFFAKSIDKVRPGGVLAFVTSRFSMDKQSDRARQFLAARADLIGAIRLPNTAFLANANTEVVTDIIFLRKRAEGEAPSGPAWTGVAEIKIGDESVFVNEYYAAHPEMILGRQATDGTMTPSEIEYTVHPNEGDLAEQLAKAVSTLPEGAYRERTTSSQAAERKTFERDMDPKAKKEGGLYVGDDGELYRKEQGTGRRLEEVKALSPAKQEWIKGYIELRDLMKQARVDQLNDGDWEASLKALNKGYDAFLKKHGNIKAFTERERTEVDEEGNERDIVTRIYKNNSLLRLDVESPLVMELERIDGQGNIVKSPFLLGRVLQKPTQAKIESTHDALMVSLSDRGRLDIPHIAGLRKMSTDAVIAELGDAIYQVPGGEQQLADEYLSGDVVAKLEEARVAAATDPAFERNVKALYDVQPKPLGSADITVGLGSPWIDAQYINTFADEVLGVSIDVTHNTSLGTWDVPDSKRQSRGNSEWGTPRKPPEAILEAALNNRTIVVKDTWKDDTGTHTQVNAEQTAAANDMVRKMRESFGRWVWQDATRATTLLETYNRQFNNMAPRFFNGDHLQLPGLSTRWRDGLHSHQKRTIWRQIQTGNSYLAHAVGAGKTMEMIVGAMEQKRLGLINKPMFVVPNHMLNQFAGEFLDAYPAADIMVADEENFHTTNRQRFVGAAAMNAPDAIIITHSAFGILQPPADAAAKVLERLTDELRAILDDLPKEERRSRSQIEQRIEQLERRFGGRTNADAKDQGVGLDDMGVDFLYVDEAHEFRKLDFATNRNNVKGIDPNGSARALDLYIKTKALGEAKPGRSHVFASGTPVTNTLGELYSIQRFMDEDALIRDGLGSFDSWASQFGEVASFDERNAAGNYEVINRFAKFVNVPELMSRVRSFMDVLTSNQLGTLVQRPAVVGGGPKIEIAPGSPALKGYMESLARRIDTSRKWKPSKDEPGNPDPLINIITDGRLAAIDMRYVSGVSADPTSKLERMIDNIIDRHAKIKGTEFVDITTGKVEPIKGATQIVFSAVGFGEQVSKNRGFDVRAYMSKRFREGGIEPDQVAWMSDYKSHAKKEAMFRQMREGKIRVLIGSPKNMGTGLNVQKRLQSLHYLSPPWFPSDVEQPHGRILRQGNQNLSVGLNWYATQGTYDSTQWQMIARKGRFIEQALTGGADVRRLDDISEVSQYEQASALASGDERVIRYTRLKRDVDSLELLRSAHHQEQIQLRSKRDSGEYRVRSLGKQIDLYAQAIAAGGGKYTSPSDVRAQVAGKSLDSHADVGEALAQLAKKAGARLNQEKSGNKDTADVGNILGKFPVTLDLTTFREEAGIGVRGEFMVQVGPLKVHAGAIYDIREDLSPQKMAALSRSLFEAVSGVTQDKAKLESDLRETQADLEATRARIGAPFDRAQELADKIAEAAKLREDLLKTDVAPPPDDLDREADAIAAQRWNEDGGRIAEEEAGAKKPKRSIAEVGGIPDEDAGVKFSHDEPGLPAGSSASNVGGHEATQADLDALHAGIQKTLRQSKPGAVVPADGFAGASLPDPVPLGQLAAAFGARLAAFRVSAKYPDLKFFSGATGLRPGVIFVRADSARPHLWVLGHELWHRMERDDPKLAEATWQAIKPLLKNGTIGGEFADRYRAMGMSDADVRSEFMGDVIGDGFTQSKFWDALGARSPSLLTKILTALKVLIDKARRIYSPRTAKFFTDFDKVLQLAGDAMAMHGANAEARAAGEQPIYSHDVPTWYSALERRLGDIKVQKAPPAQWERILDSLLQKGVKKEEIEWSGVKDWLKTQTGSIDRAAVLAFVRDNGVKVTETMLGENQGAARSAVNVEIDRLTVELTALGYTPEIGYEVELEGVTRNSDGMYFTFNRDGETELHGQDGEWTNEVAEDPEGGAKLERLPPEAATLATRIGVLREQLASDSPVPGEERDTQYGHWQLPGGKNYRELLLTLPDVRPSGRQGKFVIVNRDDDVLTKPYATREDAERVLNNDPQARDAHGLRVEPVETEEEAFEPARFRSGHFDQPNILAHVRFNERTDADGKRVLFIEEIQSDWAQKGRKQGFEEPKTPEQVARIAEIKREIVRLKEYGTNEADREAYFKPGATVQGYGGTDEVVAYHPMSGNRNWSVEVREVGKTYGGEPVIGRLRNHSTDPADKMIQALQHELHDLDPFGSRVPTAPFVQKTEAWTALALKRMIRYAVDNGFDAVAWTNGEQQADRYSLAKQVDSLLYAKLSDGTYRIKVTKTRGGDPTSIGEPVAEDKLEDVVGKEIAKKIISGEGTRTHGAYTQLSNIDLKVGGEGMIAFYDKIIPQVANDVLKKLGGGKVGTVNVHTVFLNDDQKQSRAFMAEHPEIYSAQSENAKEELRGKTWSQPGFAITPEMRALAEGPMPLFSRDEPTEGPTSPAGFAAAATAVRGRVQDFLASDRTFNNWWHKTVGTQYHKAEISPEFKVVFDKTQDFIADTSQFSINAARFAPDLLPLLESTGEAARDLADLLTGGSKTRRAQKDAAAAGRALFAGTLNNVVYSDADLARGHPSESRPPLSPKQISLYRQARNAIDRSLDELAASEAGRLLRAAKLPVGAAIAAAKANPGQAHAIFSAALDKLQRDNPMLTDDLQEPAGKIDALFQKIQKLQSEGYAPLMRFGKFSVYVTYPDARPPEFYTFERERDQKRMLRTLREDPAHEGATVTPGTMAQQNYQLFEGMSPEALELFINATGLEADPLVQEYLKQVTATRSALKRLIHRKGVEGFSGDTSRVLASFVTSNARLASRNYHYGDLLKAAEAIPKEKGDVIDEAAKLIKYVQNPSEEASTIRGLLFVNFLGGSIASAMVNATQPVMMTGPYLSQFSNPAKAFAALAKYAKYAAGGKIDDAEMNRAVDRAIEEGHVAPHEIHQLYAESIRGMGSNIWWRRGLRVWGSLFSLAESFNRKLTFAAAYDLARDMSRAQLVEHGVRSPYQFAVKAVQDTQGIYNRGNRPNWARGAVGATIFTFKQFTVSYLEFVKRLPAREKALALAVLVVAAGLQGLPGADDMEDLIDTIGQSLGYNTNSKKAMREAVMKALGEHAGGFVLHGVSGIPGVPFDIQARLGVNNILPGTALFKRSETDKTRDVAEFAGPIGGLLSNAMTAFSAAQAGQGGNALQAMAPTAIANVWKAVDMLQTGQYTDSKGRKVIATDTTDAVLKGIGLQPQDVAEASRKAQGVRQDIAMVRTVEAGIADRLAQARLDHDRDAEQSARDDLRSWNERNPDSRIVINPGQIQRRLVEMKSERAGRLEKSAPREVRAGVRESLQ